MSCRTRTSWMWTWTWTWTAGGNLCSLLPPPAAAHNGAKCNECSYSFMSTVMTFYIGCVPSTTTSLTTMTTTTSTTTSEWQQQLQLMRPPLGRLYASSERGRGGVLGNWSAEGLGPGPARPGHRQVSVVIEK